MATIKLVEWQDESGYWHAADTSNLSAGSNQWWLAPRVCRISLTDWVQMIVTKYKPDRIKYSVEYDVLTLAWRSQAAMRKYKNEVNAMIRKVM